MTTAQAKRTSAESAFGVKKRDSSRHTFDSPAALQHMRDIRAIVDQHIAATQKEIMAGTGLSPGAVSNYLKEMCATGQLHIAVRHTFESPGLYACGPAVTLSVDGEPDEPVKVIVRSKWEPETRRDWGQIAIFGMGSAT